MEEGLEELISRQLVIVQRQCAKCVSEYRRYDFASQLERASRSISNNYHEGFATRYLGDKLRFLDYAKRSCNEVLCMLEEPWYRDAFPSDEVTDLEEILFEVDLQLFVLMRYLSKKRSSNLNPDSRKNHF